MTIKLGSGKVILTGYITDKLEENYRNLCFLAGTETDDHRGLKIMHVRMHELAVAKELEIITEDEYLHRYKLGQDEMNSRYGKQDREEIKAGDKYQYHAHDGTYIYTVRKEISPGVFKVIKKSPHGGEELDFVATSTFLLECCKGIGGSQKNDI